MQDIYEAIRAGRYDNKVDYPRLTKNDPARREAMTLYRRGAAAANELFKTEALEAVGLTDHPKAQAVWDKASEYGHSSGYQGVFQYLEELAELVLV